MSAFHDPILAFGMPRSGTTWIGKIFDSHSGTLYRHEPDTWQMLQGVPLFADPRASEHLRREVRAFVASLPGMRADRVCGKRPFFAKAYATPGQVRAFEARSLLHKGLSRIGIETSPPMPPQPAPGSGYRVVWKSIESLGRAGMILDSVPEARFVQIVRHPCGYVASVLKGEAQKRFGHNEAAHDFNLFEMACATPQARRHGLTLAQIKSMTPEERLAWRWVIFNEKAQDELGGRPQATVLYYEQLCSDPEGIARSVFEFCGLPWDRQTDRFLRRSTTEAKSDYYSVFKNPEESAWRWKADLGAEQIRRVLAIAERTATYAPYAAQSDWNAGA
jgi:hypothetical protein